MSEQVNTGRARDDWPGYHRKYRSEHPEKMRQYKIKQWAKNRMRKRAKLSDPEISMKDSEIL